MKINKILLILILGIFLINLTSGTLNKYTFIIPTNRECIGDFGDIYQPLLDWQNCTKGSDGDFSTFLMGNNTVTKESYVYLNYTFGNYNISKINFTVKGRIQIVQANTGWYNLVYYYNYTLDDWQFMYYSNCLTTLPSSISKIHPTCNSTIPLDGVNYTNNKLRIRIIMNGSSLSSQTVLNDVNLTVEDDLLFVENNQTYNSPVSPNTNNQFSINISYDSTYYSGISAVLNYNNTIYSSSSSGSGNNLIFTASTTSPNLLTGAIIPFYWNISLTNSSGTTYIKSNNYTQNISVISIDNCTTNTNKILNLTMFNEDTNAYLNISGIGTQANGTINIDVRLSSPSNPLIYTQYVVSQNNKNPVQICVDDLTINNTFRMDANIQYYSSERVTRWAYVRNYLINSSTAPVNKLLYNLLETESQEFKITYKNNQFLLMPNAVIDIQKYYPSSGYYATVEQGLTDSYGVTLGHFVLGTSLYNINVYEDGVLVSSFPNIQPICNNIAYGDCQINLNALSSAYEFMDWSSINNLNYLYNFDEGARTLTLNWNLQDTSLGIAVINMTVLASDMLNNQIICSTQSSGTIGTYVCNIPDLYGNGTITADLYKDGIFIHEDKFTVNKNDSINTFGNTGIILAFVIVICIGLMFTGSPTGVMIGVVLGIIMVGLLGILALNSNTSQNTVLAVGGTIGFILAVAITIIWRINTSSGGTA